MSHLEILECAVRKDGTMMEFKNSEVARTFCAFVGEKMESKLCEKHKRKFLDKVVVFEDMKITFCDSEINGTMVLVRMGAEVSVHDGVLPFYDCQRFISEDMKQSARGMETLEGAEAIRNSITAKHVRDEMAQLVVHSFEHIVTKDVAKISDAMEAKKIEPITALELIEKRRAEITALVNDDDIKKLIMDLVFQKFSDREDDLKSNANNKKEKKKIMTGVAMEAKNGIEKIIRSKLSVLEV